jgi:hypothetical protein
MPARDMILIEMTPLTGWGYKKISGAPKNPAENSKNTKKFLDKYCAKMIK